MTVEIFEIFDGSKIDDTLLKTIEKWYLDDADWINNKPLKVHKIVSSVLGQGSSARAYLLDTQKIIKEFFPTENYLPFLDETTHKVLPSIKNDSQLMQEFKNKLRSFVCSVESSWKTERDYIDTGGTAVLNTELWLTSIGVCVIAPQLTGDCLDLYIEKNKINSRQDLTKALECIERLICIDLFVYHRYGRIHADVKPQNYFFLDIDGDKKTTTVRSLDFGSVFEIVPFLEHIHSVFPSGNFDNKTEQEKFNLMSLNFESTPNYYSEKLRDEIIKEVIYSFGKLQNEILADLFKELDLLAAIKILFQWLLDKPNWMPIKQWESFNIGMVFDKISSVLNQESASFKVYHIAYIFVCLLTQIHTIECCVASNSPELETGNPPPRLLNNILSGEEFKQKIQNLIDILKDGEKCYIDNHANLDDQFQKSILDAKGIYTMKEMFERVMKDFNKELVHPGEILSKWAYN